MAEVIRMPRMSDTMEEGVIVEWLKEEGDEVEPGDVLAEVETDKATMELESYHEGVLLHIGVKEGAVPVNGILAVIGEEGEDYEKALEEAKKEEPSNGEEEGKEKEDEAEKEEDKAEEKEKEKNSDAEKPDASGEAAPEDAQKEEKRIKASPLAKSMAKEAGIDLEDVKGTGDNGRIIKRDIEDYIEERKKAPEKKEAPAEEKEGAFEYQPFAGESLDREDEEITVSQMRKTIARRLGESKFSAPHFYLTIEIDMERAVEARKSLNDLSPVKISFNDLVVKACAIALRQHPAVNSSWLGDKIRRNGNINIGVAVAVDEGLLVPVVRHADHKTLSQINTEVKELAGKARKRKLQPEEMEGNTFTVSNLGMFGIEEFTAIINPPDSCILAVGGIMEKAVVVDGAIQIGKRMKVTMSCDHRVVDGATGSEFLQTFKALMEDPVRILI